MKRYGAAIFAVLFLTACSQPNDPARNLSTTRSHEVEVRGGHIKAGESRFEGFPNNVYVALDKKTGLLCNTYDFYKGRQRKTSDSFENLPLCADLYLNQNVAVQREVQAFDTDRSEEGGDVK